MTGRTIAGTYTAGISLTDPGDNPVTVLSGGIIDTGSGVALQGSSGTYWTIGNAGMVEATGTTAGDIGVLLAGGGAVTNLTGGTIGGYDFGVSITGTGSVINDGHIGASKTVKPGYSYNSTTGVFTPLNAGVALGGGGISNAASAVISGYFQGVALGGNGSVVNAGTVQGGYGIVLTDGGTVSNASSGTVTSAGYGVLALGTNTAALDNQGVINSKDAVGVDLFRGGSLNNAGAALITGAMSGVVLGASTLGTVTNAGSIIGDQRVGVALYGGGSATNAAAGTIGGGYFGLRAANTASSVSVVNFGSLFSVQSYTGSPGFDAAGVNLVGGGTVSNGLTGRIQSTWKGVEIGNPSASAPGTVLNQGFIYASNSNGSTGAGVWINGPAMISNAASGTIAGGPFAIVVYNATTLVNYGRIAAVQYGTHTAFALDVVNPGFAESVAVAPGATFVGVVSGGNSIGSSVVSTLEFRSGNQIGSLSGIGSHYVEFGHISIDSGASWQLTGSNTLVAGGTLTNSGTLTLSNAILGDAGVLENDGVIAIDPSLLQVTNLTGNGALTLGAGSTIDSQGTIAAGETITFASTAAPLLQLEAPGSMAGSVVGFAQGDTIDLAGVDPASVQYAGGVLSFSVGGSAAAFSLGLASKASLLPPSSDGKGGTQITAAALCFCAGTRIATRDGDIAVERLQVGDLVRVVHPRNELAAVVWMGHRTVNCARHPDPRKVWPVRIAAGAFGAGRPYRDVQLSPDHAVFVDDVLIPIKYLINGTTIVQTPVDEVSYHHVELARHAVLLAEGMSAESYLDTGGRGNFANGGEAVALHPDFTFRTWDAEGCAPLVVTGPQLRSARERVNAFANATERRRRHSRRRNVVLAAKRR
jgi:collagen type I/II/III/V/XI/XXIV/XXVII alpha